jgi:hypothetical protein
MRIAFAILIGSSAFSLAALNLTVRDIARISAGTARTRSRVMVSSLA